MRGWLACALAFAVCGTALAHHSFASYYGPSDAGGLVTVEGTLSQFRFTNPHGILVVIVLNAAGADERWTVETLAPAMLLRAGWKRDSLMVGERVKVQGWRARDGSRLMRLQNVVRADGTMLGAPVPGGAPQK